MKVVIAVDSSVIAERTFDWYFDSVHKDENEVFVVHHAEPPKLPTMAFSSGAAFPAGRIQEIMVEFNSKMADIEYKFTSKLNKHKCVGKVIMESTDEKAGDAIVRKAEELDAGLIVIGSRGLGAIKRTLIGSVSHRVIHSCSIPVIVCPIG